MKCQKCEKPATFHITELTGDEPTALHFCAECAEIYLKPADEIADSLPTLGDALTQQLKVGQTAEDLQRLDQKSCPICGISFREFRKSGRLGCPHDYTFFAEELESLIVNIHGETKHVGKHPKKNTNIDQQTKLIRLRREMKEAVEREEYERASELRDEIKRLEGDKSP